MLRYNSEIIEKITELAKSSERKRVNHNFHKIYTELQRLLNAVEPESYIKPHKHAHTFEIFLIIKGKMAFFEFDDNGSIKDKVLLEPNKTFGIEVEADTWHSMLALEKGSVIYILMEGPYNEKTHKILPSWAPEEGSVESIEFMKTLYNAVNNDTLS